MIAIIRILSEEDGDKLRDAIVAHKKGSLISEYIIEHKEELQSQIEGKGHLLYLTRLAKIARRGDVSLVVHMNEPGQVAEFVARTLSKIEGVTSIWIINLFKPVFYPLPKDTKRFKRYAITINTAPNLTSEVYETLETTKLPDDLLKSYLGYTFSSFGESLQFSILAEHDEAANKYLAELNAMSGVKRTNLFPIEMTKPLFSYDEWKDYSKKHNIVPSWDDKTMMEQFEDWEKTGVPKK